MPKTFLTEEQRREDRYRKLRLKIGDGLNNFKNRNRVTKRSGLTNEEIAKNLGMGNGTIGRIIAGEDVQIHMNKFFRVLDLAGMEIRARKEEDGK